MVGGGTGDPLPAVLSCHHIAQRCSLRLLFHTLGWEIQQPTRCDLPLQLCAGSWWTPGSWSSSPSAQLPGKQRAGELDLLQPWSSLPRAGPWAAGASAHAERGHVLWVQPLPTLCHFWIPLLGHGHPNFPQNSRAMVCLLLKRPFTSACQFLV